VIFNAFARDELIGVVVERADVSTVTVLMSLEQEQDQVVRFGPGPMSLLLAISRFRR